MTCHTYLANGSQISYTPSVECIVGFTTCKIFTFCSKNSDLPHAHGRKIPGIFAFETVETGNEATFPSCL